MLLKNDELNLITTYFEEMDIPQKEKKNRIALCEDLVFVFYYVFALIRADLRLAKPKSVEEYQNIAKDRFNGVVEFSEYEDITNYPDRKAEIEKTIDNLVKVTVDNSATEYFVSKERAIKVAQDMSNVVANNLEYEIKKEQGYKFKTWYSILDKKTRPSHWLAWGQTVPIDEPFIIGGCEMMCPCDSSAPAEEVANCRCVMRYSNSKRADKKPDEID